MTNIEKKKLIDNNRLSGEAYFTSILQQAYSCGLMNEAELESFQMECIKFLAYKSERYSCGDSSSVRVEVAESIMKSNLYTIGLYLKSLPDADYALSELRAASIPEIYKKGRDLIDARTRTAQNTYMLVQKNKLTTPNYTYNATLCDNGIGSFFKLYNPDYEAHETPASIDYQLCNPVTELEGVEYIQKYLGNLYLENEFCRNFTEADIHKLLSGYDLEYKDLLINIFEQVLTGAIACSLANRTAAKLYISKADIELLYIKLSGYEDGLLAAAIKKAAGKLFVELNITNPSLRMYINKSLPRITAGVICAVKTDTLDKTFVTPVDTDYKPKIKFLSGAKMDDEDYRKLIDELLQCRYLSDKHNIIKEKVRSLGDLEDLIFDALLSEEEILSVFDILGNIELAALIKQHPFKGAIKNMDFSEGKQTMRSYLKSYFEKLPIYRQEEILEIADNLVAD